MSILEVFSVSGMISETKLVDQLKKVTHSCCNVLVAPSLCKYYMFNLIRYVMKIETGLREMGNLHKVTEHNGTFLQ